MLLTSALNHFVQDAVAPVGRGAGRRRHACVRKVFLSGQGFSPWGLVGVVARARRGRKVLCRRSRSGVMCGDRDDDGRCVFCERCTVRSTRMRST